MSFHVGQIAALQELMREHNNALRRWQRAHNALTCTGGNFCLNYSQTGRTPNRSNVQRANREYENAYKKLKNALGQPVWLNENNLFGGRPTNYHRPTSNARWNLGVARRAISAATTIQRHVRGTQQRARTGINNPYTALGKRFIMSRFSRSNSGRPKRNNYNSNEAFRKAMNNWTRRGRPGSSKN